MKKREKEVKVTVNPKDVKLIQENTEALELCRQNIEFHKACLDIELEYEEAILEELQGRIDELQNELEHSKRVTEF